MADWHLKDLENALERSHWVVVERLPSDDYRHSGFWIIARPDGSHAQTLAFHGLDDLTALPMEQSYACTVVSSAEVGLDFVKRPGWNLKLAEFVSTLNGLPEDTG